MADLQAAKAKVRAFHADLDAAAPGASAAVLATHCAPDLLWRGMHPFHAQKGPEAAAEVFWDPLKEAIGPLQRRPDIFFAGLNQIDDWQSTWVVEMGHMLGLWETPWIGIPPSGKAAFLRYCTFHRIASERIVETAHYVDLIGFLAQDGRSPIPRTTGLEVLSPAPRTHDGLLFGSHSPEEGQRSVELIAAMVADLRANTISSPGDHMDRFWTPDMTWFGPGGIGTSASYKGYRRGHSGPFEEGLDYVRHTEHVARLGEGAYGGFFGYPSLTMRSKGFLGLPPSDVAAEMRIVDLYRREGDKLAENWIFIDLPHFFAMQGLDLLAQAQG